MFFKLVKSGRLKAKEPLCSCVVSDYIISAVGRGKIKNTTKHNLTTTTSTDYMTQIH